MRKLLIMLLLLGILAFNGYGKKLAITIDDLPIVHQSLFTKAEQLEIFNNLRDTLKRHGIKATGFVNGNKINHTFHEKMLDDFRKAGHLLGNHTYSHPDLNSTPVDTYFADILKGEKSIGKWMTTRYFRYPCLHRGDQLEKREAVRKFLEEKDYISVPVTIDNNDFLYNAKMEKALARGNEEEIRRISEEYLAHMKERTLYFEKMAQEKVGREVNHILLLHFNYLNSRYLDKLLSWYRDRGWTFISVPEALQDKIFSMKSRYIGKKGLSWLERV